MRTRCHSCVIFNFLAALSDSAKKFATAVTSVGPPAPVLGAAFGSTALLSPPAVSALNPQFGVAGDVLADTLNMFSLSLVRIVCEYFAYGLPWSNTKPKFLLSFSGYGFGHGQIKFNVNAVACNPRDGSYWISEDKSVHVFSAEGRFLFQAAEEVFMWAAGIAFDTVESGLVYIVDTSSNDIVVCTTEGKFVRRLGSRGTEPGQFRDPLGIAVDLRRGGSGLLFVTDQSNGRVQVLNRDGSFVRAFGREGTGDGEFTFPLHVAIAQNGEIFVTDRNNHRIQVFDFEGRFLRKFGRKGVDVGEFNEPHCIAIDRAGNVYVTDTDNHRVQIFEPNGAPITSFGGRHTIEGGEETYVGLKQPCALAIDTHGRIVVGDYNKHVQVVGYF